MSSNVMCALSTESIIIDQFTLTILMNGKLVRFSLNNVHLLNTFVGFQKSVYSIANFRSVNSP